MQRRVIPELLDSDQGSEREVQDSLRDLNLVNRFFGGVPSYTRLIRRIAARSGRNRMSLLDVAAGTGFVALQAAARLQRQRIAVQVSLLDRASTHLPSGDVPTLQGDALSMPLSEDSYDVVACSLFMHHLDPEQVVMFAREALRVARVAVLISDTRRSRAHLLLTYLAWPIFRSRMSRHDGPASVRRSYTIPEARDLLLQAQPRQLEIEPQFLYRIGAILWK